MKKRPLQYLNDRRLPQLAALGALLVLCSLLYYAGEIIGFFGWDSLRWSFFNDRHEIHRLLFLAPVVYTAYIFNMRATFILTLAIGGIWAPRALFISPYPAPVLRAMLFLVGEGAVGLVFAAVFRQNRRLRLLESVQRTSVHRLESIMEHMQDGVAVIGQDYRIRYTNPAMRKAFGENTDVPCYEYIRHLSVPCPDCKLPGVLSGDTARWEYDFWNGKTYEVAASSCTDTDGSRCLLGTYREIAGRRHLG